VCGVINVTYSGPPVTRLLNKRWIEAMKEQGYQGEMAVSSMVNNLYKWSNTTQKVSKDLFDRVVSTCILDEHNRSWIMENNPYAMEEITRRLLKACSRDLWEADEDMLQAVQTMALEIEGNMEEIMGEVSEDFQGEKVEVLGLDKVDKWQHEWRIGDD
jgi:cobaltochelatase CobN